jgi:hypothetical protein
LGAANDGRLAPASGGWFAQPASDPCGDGVKSKLEALTDEKNFPAGRAGRRGKEKDAMFQDFNVAERGVGSYWPLSILRWVMVLIFVSFGIQKFTQQSAEGIAV